MGNHLGANRRLRHLDDLRRLDRQGVDLDLRHLDRRYVDLDLDHLDDLRRLDRRGVDLDLDEEAFLRDCHPHGLHLHVVDVLMCDPYLSLKFQTDYYQVVGCDPYLNLKFQTDYYQDVAPLDVVASNLDLKQVESKEFQELVAC